MDKDRILSKIDEIDKYLEELESIKPIDLEEYETSIAKKRACERLLQILVEIEIDICNLLVFSLKLGMPSDEEDLFTKLASRKVISEELKLILINMKGFRNFIVHRYEEIDDEKVFEIITDKLDDFEKFKQEVLKFIK